MVVQAVAVLVAAVQAAVAEDLAAAVAEAEMVVDLVAPGAAKEVVEADLAAADLAAADLAAVDRVALAVAKAAEEDNAVVVVDRAVMAERVELAVEAGEVLEAVPAVGEADVRILIYRLSISNPFQWLHLFRVQ